MTKLNRPKVRADQLSHVEIRLPRWTMMHVSAGVLSYMSEFFDVREISAMLCVSKRWESLTITVRRHAIRRVGKSLLADDAKSITAQFWAEFPFCQICDIPCGTSVITPVARDRLTITKCTKNPKCCGTSVCEVCGVRRLNWFMMRFDSPPCQCVRPCDRDRQLCFMGEGHPRTNWWHGKVICGFGNCSTIVVRWRRDVPRSHEHSDGWCNGKNECALMTPKDELDYVIGLERKRAGVKPARPH